MPSMPGRQVQLVHTLVRDVKALRCDAFEIQQRRPIGIKAQTGVRRIDVRLNGLGQGRL
jgi:hypothetical protein